MSSHTPHPSSYRDPAGFIFEKDGSLYRQVNQSFKEDFDLFISGGCYTNLVKKGLLVSHEKIDQNFTGDMQWYTTLKPEHIPFISYPYEWSFDMLKDSSLLTLAVLKEALATGMILKDASPYNIQWHKGRLVFIDSLSFERYDEMTPWIAYRQFCEHFLSPLLLAHYSKLPVHELLLPYSDGIPLLVTSSLLPWKTHYSLHTYLHIHLHAKYSLKTPGQGDKKTAFSKKKLLNLITSLEVLINKLKTPENKTAWSEYYDEASARGNYLEHKQELIRQWLVQIKPTAVTDLGANKGEFSKLAAAFGMSVIATDFDAACINELYREIKRTGEQHILPLIIDLSKPSPAIGVNNQERASFIDRTDTDMVFALALIHHLAIGKNIPFEKIAAFFQQITRYLIIEFVPKQDEKVQLMLGQKKDIYQGYTAEDFEAAFKTHFTIEAKEKISGSERTLYRMKRNEG